MLSIITLVNYMILFCNMQQQPENGNEVHFKSSKKNAHFHHYI